MSELLKFDPNNQKEEKEMIKEVSCFEDNSKKEPKKSEETNPKKKKNTSKKKKKKNCSLKCCKRKKLLYRTCRCGYDFCNLHIMPEDHNCSYDYKTEGRKQLEKDNLSAIPKKFTRI